MDLIVEITKELERGFSKSELERIWELPKNSLSAVLNPKLPAKLSKKSEVRVREYFEKDPINRPEPSLKIEKGAKKITPDKPTKQSTPPPKEGQTEEKTPKTTFSGYDRRKQKLGF